MVCAHLLCLVACAADACQECEPNITYFAREDGLLRKRRKPKQKELRVSQKPAAAWRIGNVCARTNKHKQGAYKIVGTACKVSASSGRKKPWTPDSGATVSVTNDLSSFVQITQSNPDVQVGVANGQVVEVVCIGTVELKLNDSNGAPYNLLVENVMYSPHFSGPLLSVEELYRQHKIATLFRGQHGCFLTPDDVVIPFSSINRRYKLEVNAVQYCGGLVK